MTAPTVLLAFLITPQANATTPATSVTSQGVGALDDPSSEAAAFQIAIDNSLTVSEARAQILNQASQIEQSARAQAALGQGFGGSYIDRTIGKLVVLGTEASSLQQWLNQETDGSHVEARLVNHPVSYYETDLLNVTKAHLAADDLTPLGARYDASAGKLEVSVGASPNAAITSFVSTNLPDVSVNWAQTSQLMTCNTSLGSLTCSSPMRGGIYIKGSSHSACSSGFMVKANSGPNRYILTAGHCTSSGQSGAFSALRYPDKASISLGTSYAISYDTSFGHDSGILHLTNSTNWGFGTNGTIYVMASSSKYNGITYTTTANENYPIHNAGLPSSLPQGAELCRTGTSSGTACGPYIGMEAGKDYFDLRVKVCSGDSGGPVFINNIAYGVVSGSVNAISGCTQPTTDQYMYAQSVIPAMSQLGVTLVVQ